MTETTQGEGDPIVVWMTRLATFRWLSPDAATETLAGEVRQRIEALVDEHFAAIARPDDAAELKGEVLFTRSMRDAQDRWEAAWREEPSPDALAHVIRLAALRDALDAPPSTADGQTDSPDALIASLTFVLRASKAPIVVVGDPIGQGVTAFEQLPATATLLAHALHLARHGERAPSPWGPLVTLWEMGTWPMILPSGRVLIYVPVRDAEGLVPDAEHPENRLIPTRSPMAARQCDTLPPLHRLGVGPGPCLWPRPMEIPSAPPDWRESMVLSGAVAPVTPYPPGEPFVPLPVGDIGSLRNPPPPPPPEPWYKRLARRFGR